MFRNLIVTLLWGFLLLSGAYGCRTNDNHDQTNKDVMQGINKVLDSHSKEWMDISGVVGCYATVNDNGQPCIRIMIKKRTPELVKKLPTTIESYPVEIEESGEIKPLKK